MLVDEYYAKEKRPPRGDTIHLIDHNWHLAGIFESGKLTRMAVQLPSCSSSQEIPITSARIYLKLDDPRPGEEVVTELHKKLPNYPIYTMEEFTSMLSISSVGLLRNFIGVPVIGVAADQSLIVVYMAVPLHRRPGAHSRDQNAEAIGASAGGLFSPSY